MPLVPHASHGRRGVLIQTSTPCTRRSATQHVVVAEEHDAAADVGPPDEVRSTAVIRACPARPAGCALPAMISCTGRCGSVSRRSSRIRIVQQQIRALVGREAARKAQRQRVGIEQCWRARRCFGRRAPCRPADARTARARIRPATAARRCGIATGRASLTPRMSSLDVCSRPQPAVLAAGLRPQRVGRRPSPTSACARHW